MLWRLFFIPIIGLILGNCSQKSEQAIRYEQELKIEKRIKYPQKDSSGFLFYLSAYRNKDDLQKIKKTELELWQTELQNKFNLDFKLIHFNKYFNMAFRCSEDQAKSLEYIAGVFFRDVYPLYFLYEPEEAFKIVYFKDKAEYVKMTNSDGYGFYQPSTKTLFTYSNSGAGTLWHELMHAFTDANIDHDIQQWFSEGLASFYEHGSIKGDAFVEGYVNWRLPHLQKLIQQKNYLPLSRFVTEVEMSEDNAYSKTRFLFCYLWEYGKMQIFVRTYLYDFSLNYKGKELGKKVVEEMERLLKKNMKNIEKEYKEKAMEYKVGQKLIKIRN